VGSGPTAPCHNHHCHLHNVTDATLYVLAPAVIPAVAVCTLVAVASMFCGSGIVVCSTAGQEDAVMAAQLSGEITDPVPLFN